MRCLHALLLAALPGAFLLGGCPAANPSDNSNSASPVTAVITATATSGSAPLIATFSADNSTTTNGGTLTFAWTVTNLAGEVLTTKTDQSFTFTFEDPGQYRVVLLATDSTNASGSDVVQVRLKGATPTAAITASATAGPTPLIVDFDGRSSSAPDDTILDYYWDFNDGTTSRLAAPRHLFTIEGTFEVSLRVVTTGGAEATTTQTISVGERNGSLQFDGAQFAALPLSSSQSLSTLTFETWFTVNNAGGSIASIGANGLTIQVNSAADQIVVQINGASTNLASGGLSGSWRHLAVVFNAAGGGAVYVDGALLGSLPAGTAITADSISLGVGFRGKLAEARLWSTARTPSEINANDTLRVSGDSVGLVGAWPLFEGSGQTLSNRAGGPAGTLGATSAAESSDPAWSTDGPPL